MIRVNLNKGPNLFKLSYSFITVKLASTLVKLLVNPVKDVDDLLKLTQRVRCLWAPPWCTFHNSESHSPIKTLAKAKRF